MKQQLTNKQIVCFLLSKLSHYPDLGVSAIATVTCVGGETLLLVSEGGQRRIMEQEVNVKKGRNLVCKHRNEISREIQNRLKEKVSLKLHLNRGFSLIQRVIRLMQ